MGGFHHTLFRVSPEWSLQQENIADDILKVLLECATEEYYFGARLKPNPEGYTTQNGTTFHMVDRTNRVHPVFYIVIKK